MTSPNLPHIPANVRFTIYVTLALGSIVEAYLLSKGIIGIDEDIAWKAFTVFAGGLAAMKTDFRELR